MNKLSYLALMATLFFLCESSFAKGTLSISKSEIMNDNANIDDFNSFLNLELTKKAKLSTNYNYSYDINVRKYNNDDTPLFSLSSFYLEKKMGSDSSISLGRKLMPWNEAASFWTLGEVFSTQGFDLLEDREEGLTGLHINYKRGSFSLDFFGSGVFIPALNPSLNIGEGRISAMSEWSALPPQQVSLEGQLIPIEYNVVIPSLSELLVKESVALRIAADTRLGSFSLYGGRKPENSFRINATGLLDQSGDDKVSVSARPFTNMQNFYGGTLTNTWSDKFRTSMSYEAVRPDRGIGERYEIGGFAVEPVYQNISYATFLAEYVDDLWGVKFSALRALDSYEDTDEAFAKRLRFENAIATEAHISISDELMIKTKYQYDSENRDQIFVGSGLYRLSKKMSLSLRYQMIESPTDNSFWSRYRENDLWQANLAFNF